MDLKLSLNHFAQKHMELQSLLQKTWRGIFQDPLSLLKILAVSADMSMKEMVRFLKKYDSKVSEDFSVTLFQCFLKRTLQFMPCFTQIDGSNKGKNLQLEELKHSCLCELIASHINVEEKKKKKKKSTISGVLEGCKLQISEGRPSLLISPSNSRRDIDVDLICSICLDVVFDPVSLACGHFFCYMCACSAGSVTTIDGIKAADSTSKCPLCRKEGVFGDAERMSHLHQLLKTKLPEYWKERREKERRARMAEAKQYWELQCRAFLGVQ